MTAMQRTRPRNAARWIAAMTKAGATHWLPQIELAARIDSDGKWRWIGANPCDEELYDYEVAKLVPLPLLAG